MDMFTLFSRLPLVEIRRLLMIIGVAIAAVTLFQSFEYGKRWNSPLAGEGSVVTFISHEIFANSSRSSESHFINTGTKDEVGDENGRKHRSTQYNLSLDNLALKLDINLGKRSIMGHDKSTDNDGSAESEDEETGLGGSEREIVEGIETGAAGESIIFPEFPKEDEENMDTDSRTFDSLFSSVAPSAYSITQTGDTQHDAASLRTVSVTMKSNSPGANISVSKRWNVNSISVSQMNSILLQSFVSSRSLRPRRSSVRDLELLSAKLSIANAPSIRATTGLHASVFRNVSMFKRSYELMERTLKIYIYKEGEKPIFHQPKMRGIYASEGWFMKLIEGNKKFVVRDPKKAHLFFLPFSSLRLRMARENFNSTKDLEEYMKNYVDLIARKYSFWNRTGGTDHFLVACHDWAPKITSHHLGNCIRALCNANVARGFKLGKDTTLPVTYIRSVETPIKDLGGNTPSERPILAFFAGGLHGYLRPILLQYWENKEPDVKIFGPMPRDIEGKRMYREHMKSSKYCICARGYEVHTPRVVEAILYECVPVIISDNYVPPFFEVLNWEAFAVFVQEKDIPNLRNILLSIPTEKYLEMQLAVKMVQQHFLWHKKPAKYDLFHMILHAVWYNRVFQMKS